MSIIPFICLYATCIGSWRDPPEPVTFEVSTTATNPVKIGDVVTFTCTSINHRQESTLEWIRINADTESRADWGRSTLVHTRTITANDHGTEFFCGSWFTRTMPEGDMITFYAKSEKFSLQVEGVTTSPPTPNFDQTRIWINVEPNQNTYAVGDVVEWVCDAENWWWGLVEMRQVKGNYETQVYTGYQLGYRWLSSTLTETDSGTYMQCRAALTDWQWNSYELRGPQKDINFN